MKKLLVLGFSACLLFSFTGSAFAASHTDTTANKKAVHAVITKKKAGKTLTHAKKQAVIDKNVKVKATHKKAATKVHAKVSNK